MASEEISEDRKKGGGVQVRTDPDQPPGSSSSDKANEADQLSDRSLSPGEHSSRRLLPRRLDALLHQEPRRSAEVDGDGAFPFYKVYKRRWFGLVQLTLLNIIVSWDVSGTCGHDPDMKTIDMHMFTDLRAAWSQAACMWPSSHDIGEYGVCV